MNRTGRPRPPQTTVTGPIWDKAHADGERVVGRKRASVTNLPDPDFRPAPGHITGLGVIRQHEVDENYHPVGNKPVATLAAEVLGWAFLTS